jgi:hypothetical protein
MSNVKNIIGILCFNAVLMCCTGALAADSATAAGTDINQLVTCSDKTATFGGDVQFESYTDWTSQHEKMAVNRVKGLDKQVTPENIKQAKIYLALSGSPDKAQDDGNCV